MRFSSYLSDKKAVLLVCFANGLFFSVLLWLFGLGSGEISLLWFCFICIVGGLLLWSYLSQHKRLQHLRAVMDALDQKYLFAEITDTPTSELEKSYFELMKTALKDRKYKTYICAARRAGVCSGRGNGAVLRGST